MAALAMLALVVQLLIPAAAMAQGQPMSMTVCTGKGVTTITVDADGNPVKHFGGLACQDCLASSLATLAAEPPVFVSAPHVIAAEIGVVSATTIEPRAQAPPRPPSQGPPLSI